MKYAIVLACLISACAPAWDRPATVREVQWAAYCAGPGLALYAEAHYCFNHPYSISCQEDGQTLGASSEMMSVWEIYCAPWVDKRTQEVPRFSR